MSNMVKSTGFLSLKDIDASFVLQRRWKSDTIKSVPEMHNPNSFPKVAF